MSSDFSSSSFDLAQTHPGLGALRMACLLAESGAEPDDEALNLIYEVVNAGCLVSANPRELWPELKRGLMTQEPSKFLRILRRCGALSQLAPEVSALFGVPQLSDSLGQVDIGAHVLEALDEAARRDAPVAVRFALFVMNVGKSDSPPEHLPVHYKHVDRGHPRIEALCARVGAPRDSRDLAMLALAECERVHRVSEVRAGPIALMLERLGAFGAPEQFRQFMTVCACDFCAHPGHGGKPYAQAALLGRALDACAGIAGDDPDALATARAEAIAVAFNSQRWS
ncbi:tRNA nucleotidyltransferase [Methylocystis heyeri]|uniref:tRNA nucleotidyltransferase n=1 Tax=Methylocystis heyeri TaxID=391905 RepID=A0A6B8KAE2_9HYPH|nr:tRNA nucleotidyltransferase [Methylocystis heyeri]QGM44819.1 tRNA nucleotidyltransferase [Methylocystis heyeri]